MKRQGSPLGAGVLLLVLLGWGGWSAWGISSAAEAVLASIRWVQIPAGEFAMGSTPEEIEAAQNEARLRSIPLDQEMLEIELPLHAVFLDAFEISQHEITNAQYRRFVEDTGHPRPRGFQGEDLWSDPKYNAPDQPVVGVSWHDARAFAEWLGVQLPSEAQWERAARGLERRKYPLGGGAANP
ncbi:MAG: hypothetical protein KatS3mg115_1451 [Candidatus Poribacteria bacterium]|nr:MAG: hypothetical protein KatS3mg115_1451 [Candidatus Poribacteria bacterium]